MNGLSVNIVSAVKEIKSVIENRQPTASEIRVIDTNALFGTIWQTPSAKLEDDAGACTIWPSVTAKLAERSMVVGRPAPWPPITSRMAVRGCPPYQSPKLEAA